MCNDTYVDTPCGTTPSTAGDPLIGSIARNMHDTNCALKSLAVSASDLQSLDHTDGTENAPKPSDIFQQSDDDNNVSALMAGLNSAGFLSNRTCPGFKPVMLGGVDMMATASQAICEAGPYEASFVLLMGYVFGALIIAKSRGGA